MNEKAPEILGGFARAWRLLAALALMGTGGPQAAGVATPSAAATPATDPKIDPCGSAKSKWQHFQCMQFNSSAAGDEYFGHLKLSYLGIHNVFKDGAISAGAYTTDPRLISKLMNADDALREWEKKYPSDPELARSYFLGEQVWRKVYTQDGQRIAWEYIQTLTHKYGSTYFGKTIAASLAKNGFTEHWFALPQMCPAPLPRGVRPATNPRVTPTPTPAPGQPPVDVITPPCVKSVPTRVAHASPRISPSPSPSPKGKTKSVPSPSPSPVAYPSGYKSPGALPLLTPSPSPNPSKHP